MLQTVLPITLRKNYLRIILEELKLYDEAYQKYLEKKAREALEKLLIMSDEELGNILAGTPEEVTMRALGYTKKEGKRND